MNESKVSLQLSEEEGLVLLEFLNRIIEDHSIEALFADQAEQRVLWDMESVLEKQLPVFSPDYPDLVARARSMVRDRSE